jgi:hypothetical protein
MRKYYCRGFRCELNSPSKIWAHFFLKNENNEDEGFHITIQSVPGFTSLQLLDRLADFHLTWHQCYAIEGYALYCINFLQPLVTTWLTREILRWKWQWWHYLWSWNTVQLLIFKCPVPLCCIILIYFFSQTQLFFLMLLLLLLLLLIYDYYMFRPISGGRQVHITKTKRRCKGWGLNLCTFF